MISELVLMLRCGPKHHCPGGCVYRAESFLFVRNVDVDTPTNTFSGSEKEREKEGQYVQSLIPLHLFRDGEKSFKFQMKNSYKYVFQIFKQIFQFRQEFLLKRGAFFKVGVIFCPPLLRFADFPQREQNAPIQLNIPHCQSSSQTRQAKQACFWDDSIKGLRLLKNYDQINTKICDHSISQFIRCLQFF